MNESVEAMMTGAYRACAQLRRTSEPGKGHTYRPTSAHRRKLGRNSADLAPAVLAWQQLLVVARGRHRRLTNERVYTEPPHEREHVTVGLSALSESVQIGFASKHSREHRTFCIAEVPAAQQCRLHELC